MAQLKTPCLRVVNLNDCVKAHIPLVGVDNVKVIIHDDYAFKVFNYAYLAKDEQHGLEFANEFTVLSEAK